MQRTAPGALGWEPWNLPACLSFRLSVCAPTGWRQQSRGTRGPEALDLETPTLTVPRDCHPGTWGAPALILPALSVVLGFEQPGHPWLRLLKVVSPGDLASPPESAAHLLCDCR